MTCFRVALVVANEGPGRKARKRSGCYWALFTARGAKVAVAAAATAAEQRKTAHDFV